MATSSRYLASVLIGSAIALTTVACTAGGSGGSFPRASSVTSPTQANSSGRGPAGTLSVLAARQAPASWPTATLPDGGAVLAYPASMRLLSGDVGTVTTARFSATGQYLLYLNVTPKQGAESLRDWAAFRISHQRAENTLTVRELAARSGVRFLGGTGTCVSDAYVTKVGARHFTEIACFVRGRTSASVIVAAAPTADWAQAVGLLRQVIAGFQVR